MRAVQLALLVVSIQVGLGIITESGLFSGTFYESSLTNIQLPSSPSATSESEQSQASINVMNTVWNALTWGWIKTYFEPFYSMDAGVKGLVDHLVTFLNSLSAFLIGIAFIEFARNRINVLGGG